MLGLVVSTEANQQSQSFTSQAGIDVYGPMDHYAPLGNPDWGEAKEAVATWVHPAWPSIPGAIWISSSYLNGDGGIPVSDDSWRWFHDVITLSCTAENIESNAVVAATSDNAEEFYFNGLFVGSDGDVQGPSFGGFEWNTIKDYPITLLPGDNTIDFIVRNYGYDPATATPYSNPTGLIYSATITYEVPDVQWQPPVTNRAFKLKDGTTLPLKFRLYTQEGNLITDEKDVYMIITCGTSTDATKVWYPGDGVDDLRFDPWGYHYIANFKTRDYENSSDWQSCTASVLDLCDDLELGQISFAVSTLAGTHRGNN